MPNWTKDQSLAINTRGGKIVVSAAAGSGKTAVLSQRVFSLVMQGVSIDELLIVTFTKSAAEEMKDRIKQKIEKAYEDDPNNDYLKRQISLMPLSKITTMDAFYNDLVKENFEKLKINKNFQILSKEEETILKNKVLKKVLEESFEVYDEYEQVLDMFGFDNVDLIKSCVLKIDSFLQTTAYPDEFIKKAISNYDVKNVFYRELLLKQIRQKMMGYNQLYEDVINELYDFKEKYKKILEIVKKEKNYISDLLSIYDFNGLSSRLRTIEFDALRTPKGCKDDAVLVKYKVIRDEFKKEVRKNLCELKYITDEVFFKEQERIRSVITCLFKVVLKFRAALLKQKKENNMFSFSDIAHFVIELLVKDKKKTNLAKQLSLRYKQILIDEYQDTNDLQNVIFNAISNNNKNLFIVGDVKQSIYRFRSACPDIFNNDKKNAKKDDFPKLITLSKNFRSRKEVIDFCNFVFENTMSESFGEVNYDKDERLYLGASYGDGKNLETEIIIIDGMQKKDDDEDDLTKVQKEAILVADKIKSLLDKKYKIYDNQNKMFRNIKPSDIVILLRSIKDADVFMDALRKRGISVFMEDSLEYFDNYEVKLIINFLKAIDNPYDDIALASVLNSGLFNINLDMISNIRSNDKNISLYESLLNSDDDLINNFLKSLKSLRNYSLNHLLSESLCKLYKDFNIISILSAQKGGYSRYKNLVQMINHANDYEKITKRSLHEFIVYLENVILNKESLEGINPLSDKDNVLITTIHKSKGLEYPVVILSQTAKNFNFKDLRSDIVINEELGFACNLKDDDYKLKYESVPIMAYKEYEKEKMLSEELRILYVALTRAKEKLIITGYTNNLTNLVTKASSKIGDKKEVSKLYLKNVKNYLDILIAALVRHPSLKELRSFSIVIPRTFASDSKIMLKIYDAVKIDESEFFQKQKNEKENFDYEWFEKVSGFKYETDKLGLPAYLSVSELKKEKDFIIKPNFMDKGFSSVNIGTLYHRILELLPIRKYDIKSLKEELNKMVFDCKITKDELSMISLEDVFAYLTSSIYDELLNGDMIYKEIPLDFEIPSSYYDKSLKSGKILTSGVIDLLFSKDDVYTIVDYKTDNVNNLEELKQRYQKQLDMYEYGIIKKMNAKKVKKYIYSIKLKKFIQV